MKDRPGRKKRQGIRTMPANLPPQYLKVEAEYKATKTAADRLEKLRELYRLLPKHKGTEKLQSDLKRKISELRDEVEHGRAGGSGKTGGVSRRVPREGAGQIALLGAPNSGKSSLLAALTNARPEIAAYPYTTRHPQPGIMMYQDVPVQLVDLPPLSPQFFEPWVPGLARSSDAALLVADLADDDVADALDAVLSLLAEKHVHLVRNLPTTDHDERECHLKTLLLAAKSDAPGADDRLAVIQEWFADRFPIVAVSAHTGQGLESARQASYDLLGVIRVYTKIPGRPIDRTRPFTLPTGSDVLDLARLVHQDFEQSLKFARIFQTTSPEPRTVKRDHELADGDVVELHAS